MPRKSFFARLLSRGRQEVTGNGVNLNATDVTHLVNPGSGSLSAPPTPPSDAGPSSGGNHTGILNSSQSPTVQASAIGSYTAGTQVFHNYLHPAHPSEAQQVPIREEQENQNIQTDATFTNGPRNQAQVYYNHLLTEGRGSPLWMPGPDQLLPQAYRKEGVSVGDVGILNADGGFSYLFNIFASADDLINAGRVPPSFQGLTPPNETDLEQYSCFGAWSTVTSSSVQRSTDNGFQFESSCKEGAILMMPQGASSPIYLNTERLDDYLRRHIGLWYDFLLRRGRKLQNGDIRVVFGCDKVSSWGIATFLSQSAVAVGQVVFTAPDSNMRLTRAALTYDCRGSADAKTGPQEDEVANIQGNSDGAIGAQSPLLRNQCVFLRTLNPKLSKDEWDAMVEPIRAKLGDGYWNQEIGTSKSGSAKGRRPEIRQLEPDPSVSIGSNVSLKTSIDHPSSILNDLILQRFPTTRLVVTTDDHWMRVVGRGEPFPSAEELLRRMESLFTFSVTDGVISPILCRKPAGFIDNTPIGLCPSPRLDKLVLYPIDGVGSVPLTYNRQRVASIQGYERESTPGRLHQIGNHLLAVGRLNAPSIWLS